MAQSDLRIYFDVLARWKKFIVAVVAIAAIGSVIVSFLLPKWYAARSSVIPPQGSDISSSISALVQGLALPGIGNVSPASAESQLFLAILESRTVRQSLIEQFDLVKIYKARNMDDAMRTFRNLASTGLTDQGVVEVIVEDRDPGRAAEIANAWIEHLDNFNRNARMTAGKRSRIFIEQRLEETLESLHKAEDSLSDYQQTHDSAPLGSDLSSTINAGASLLAQRLALQVQLNLMTDLYKEQAPLVQSTRTELDALDRQIRALPPLAVEYARLFREVKIQEQVFALLTAQFEEAKIREAKDVPTLEVLDAAVPPQRRSRPIRWLFCASLTLAAVVLSLGTAFSVEFFRRYNLAEAPEGTSSAAGSS